MDALIRYLKGNIKISVEGEKKMRFLRLCINHGIPLWDLDQGNDKFMVRIFAEDFKKLMPLRKKTGCSLHIYGKYGLPFWLNKNRKRAGLWAGIPAAVFIFYLLSLFIWDIRITGNHYYTDESVLEDMDRLGVFCGMRKKDVDCKKLAGRLRMDHSDMVWTSVKVEGTRLVVEIKENEDSYKETEKKAWKSGEDICAPRDGKIHKIITRKGMPLVKEGDSFKKGDVLVCGKVDILNEDGQVERSDMVVPDADIIIRTTYDYYDEFPLEHTVKQYTGEEKTRPYVKFLNKRFLLGSFSSKKKEKQEIYISEYPVFLTPGLCLPLSVGRKTVKKYIEKQEIYPKKEAEKISDERVAYHMRRMAEENIYINGKNLTMTIRNGSCVTKGSFDILITM